MKTLIASFVLAGLAGCSSGDLAALDKSVARAAALSDDCDHHFQLREANGRVLTDPGIVDVFWGSDWSTSEAGRETRGAIDRAWSALAADPRFYAPLEEYAPAGRRIAGVWLGSFLGKADLARGAALTQPAIEAELARAIAHGELPARTESPVPIYVIHLAPGVSGPVLEGESEVSYLAYHDHFALPGSGALVPYAIVLDQPGDVNAMTLAAAHEIDEAITNPFDDGWRDLLKTPRGTHEELADVCNALPARIGDLTVQEVWSQKQCACVAP